MELEVLIGIVAVFVSGCAFGSGATLLGSWARRRLSLDSRLPPPLDGPDTTMLHHDMAELISSVQEVHERLDFHERLLGGGREMKEFSNSDRQALST